MKHQKLLQPKKLSTLTVETFKPYLQYTQNEAAKMLGVSKSTLKRRFYELKLGQSWPNHNQETKRKMRTKPRRKKHSEKVQIANLILQQEEDEKHLSPDTIAAMQQHVEARFGELYLDRQYDWVPHHSPYGSHSPNSLSSTSSALIQPILSNSTRKSFLTSQMPPTLQQHTDQHSYSNPMFQNRLVSR